MFLIKRPAIGRFSMKILAAKGPRRQIAAQAATTGLRRPVWSMRRELDARRRRRSSDPCVPQFLHPDDRGIWRHAPVARVARFLSIQETRIGQLYPAIVLSRSVSTGSERPLRKERVLISPLLCARVPLCASRRRLRMNRRRDIAAHRGKRPAIRRDERVVPWI
jgi:hypothetical protein